MIRGTTPTHIYNLPFDSSLIKELRIVYAQKNDELFTKTLPDCTASGSEIRCTLTQEETFLFDFNLLVQIQLRILTTGGDVVSTKIFTKSVDECLKEEVLA